MVKILLVALLLVTSTTQAQSFKVSLNGEESEIRLKGRVTLSSESKSNHEATSVSLGENTVNLRWDGYNIDQYYINHYEVLDNTGAVVFQGTGFNQLNILIAQETVPVTQFKGTAENQWTTSVQLGSDKFSGQGGQVNLSLHGALSVPYVNFTIQGNSVYSAQPTGNGGFIVTVPLKIEQE